MVRMVAFSNSGIDSSALRLSLLRTIMACRAPKEIAVELRSLSLETRPETRPEPRTAWMRSFILHILVS